MRPPRLDYATPTTPKPFPEVRPATWLAALAIVGVVGLLRFGPEIVGRTSDNPNVRALVDLSNLDGALTFFKQDTGFLPTSDDGLNALATRPVGVTSWRGPYIKGRIPSDPWGHPYLYDPTIPSVGKPYTLFSAGPDGREGNADDIVSK